MEGVQRLQSAERLRLAFASGGVILYFGETPQDGSLPLCARSCSEVALRAMVLLTLAGPNMYAGV